MVALICAPFQGLAALFRRRPSVIVSTGVDFVKLGFKDWADK